MSKNNRINSLNRTKSFVNTNYGLSFENSISKIQKPQKLKDLFVLDPNAKRKYNAEASKRTRERKKLERAWLRERNHCLEKEQVSLEERINELKTEISQLERRDLHIDSALNLENKRLEQQVKKRRTIIERIKEVIGSELSNQDDNLLKITQSSIKRTLRLLFKGLYSSVHSGNWIALPTARNILSTNVFKLNRYFNTCGDINVSFNAETIETKSSLNLRKVCIRIDIANISVSEDIYIDAVWKIMSSNEHNIFNQITGHIEETEGVDIKFSKLSLNESKPEPVLWNLSNGRKALLYKTLVENQNDKVIIVSSGEEKVNASSIDKTFQSETGIERCHVFTNSFSASVEGSGTNKVKAQYTDDVYGFNQLVHNFENKPNSCNATIFASILEGTDHMALNPLLKQLILHNEENTLSPFYGLLISSISEAITEVIEERKAANVLV